MSTAARIDELRKKFEEHPRRYFAPLANEYRKSGELAHAIALCREHLPQQPGHMSGYIVFGQALYESGALSEARSVFEQALALDPENFIALRHLGDIAKVNGDTSAARRWYERVLDADPRNDDIAAQLASLAPIPTPPISSPPIPVFVGTPKERAIGSGSTPTLTSGVGQAPGTAVAVPTPHAAMRTVDFDEVNTRLSHQQPLDLEAMERVSEATSAAGAQAATRGTTPAETPPISALRASAAGTDDSFGFPPPGVPVDSLPVEVGPEFEAGLVTPVWPDTADLVARVVSPRAFTPVDVPITSDAVAAFGREAGDPVAPSVDDDLAARITAFEGSETSDLPIESLGDDIIRGEAEWLQADLDDSAGALPTASLVEKGEDVIMRTTELTWLVTPASNEALQWISANDGAAAIEHDASVHEIASVFAADGDPVPVADLASESRQDWHPTGGQDVVEESDASDVDHAEHRPPAFVTATMGELLVSQGYLARAVEVYEELAKRQPENVDVADRLAALRERLEREPVTSRMPTPIDVNIAPATASPTYGTPVWVNSLIPSAEGGEAEALLFLSTAAEERRAVPSRTARETFARIAARRAPRSPRIPFPAASTGQDDGLSMLFGGAIEPADDAAARALASAFAPVSKASMSDGSILDLTPMQVPAFTSRISMADTLPSQPETSDISDAFAFDRFFPDPAAVTPSPPPPTQAASTDLAEFAAWLKGLGPQ